MKLMRKMKLVIMTPMTFLILAKSRLIQLRLALQVKLEEKTIAATIADSPLKPQIPKTQITECICGYGNGTTKIANDGVIRFAIINMDRNVKKHPVLLAPSKNSFRNARKKEARVPSAEILFQQENSIA